MKPKKEIKKDTLKKLEKVRKAATERQKEVEKRRAEIKAQR